jgi:hypothetical protein
MNTQPDSAALLLITTKLAKTRASVEKVNAMAKGKLLRDVPILDAEVDIDDIVLGNSDSDTWYEP